MPFLFPLFIEVCFNVIEDMVLLHGSSPFAWFRPITIVMGL